MSGGPSTAAVKADNLKKLGILVAESRPWYEALGMTAERASGILGEDANDHVSEQGSGLACKAAELLFSATDIDALKPVCVVFKALFDAVKGAATNRDDLIDLIGYGVLIVKSIPETGPTSGLSPAVKYALQAFGAEVESVMQLAGSFDIMQQPTARRRFRPFWRRVKEVGNHAEIKKVIQGHVTRFGRIVGLLGAGAAIQSAEEAKAVLHELPNLRKENSRTRLSISAVLFVFAAVMLAHRNEIFKVLRRGQAQIGKMEAKMAVRPPSLPKMAAVPAGALVLPHSYVERAAVQEVADGLTNPEEPRTPYTVVGMGGGGKSVLASAVVRESSVREHFRGGIFWVRVGKGAKNSLLPLLQGLAREMGAAPTDSPHGVPHVLESLEQVQQHLGAVASMGNSPRLVVLDDVWEREVVDALLPLGLKVLVTTRDRSVVDVPTGCVEVGDMTEEEALELLLKTSRTMGQPGDEARTQMTEVVALCGRLPLMLAIAGSMPVVKGKSLGADAWGKLIKELEDVVTKMEASDEDSDSLGFVLEASFNALTIAKKRAFKKMAVLAPGAVPSTEMLLNLWETKDTGGTREEAEGLVGKCLLQAMGGGGYRVHDLVLDFVKIKIKADVEMVKKATTLQAHFLGRLDVLKGYESPEHGAGNQGVFVLDALWRSVEELSGDPELEVTSYTTSLRELESCEATTDVANSYASVGFLFNIQGKYAQAELLYGRCQTIDEKVLGPEHPTIATTLNNQAEVLRVQGNLDDAGPLFVRATQIWEKALGPDHPQVATALNNRAGMLRKQGELSEAELLYKRAQGIFEKSLDRDHPNVATILNNRAELLKEQGKNEAAGPLYDRSLAIREKALGPDHPAVAESLHNRAVLLSNEEEYGEAIPLFERALSIRTKKLGANHPYTVGTKNYLESVRGKV